MVEPIVTAPLARNTELTVEHLSTETIVYDLRTNRIHCLNQTLTFVWQQCDGYTSVEQITERLPDALNMPPDREIVLVALKQLNKLHLLTGELPHIGASGLPSRRELAKRLACSGAAAALIPAVTSMLAPTPSMAKSGDTHEQSVPVVIVSPSSVAHSSNARQDWAKGNGDGNGKGDGKGEQNSNGHGHKRK